MLNIPDFFLAVKLIERDELFKNYLTKDMEDVISDLDKKYLRDMEQVIADEALSLY